MGECTRGIGAAPTVGAQAKKSRAGADPADYMAPAEAWALEPHVCRVCFGRLASRPAIAGHRLYQCTNCGAETMTDDHASACCCGIKIRKANAAGRSGGPMVDAGLRCIENPRRTPDFPQLYVCAEVAAKQKAR